MTDSVNSFGARNTLKVGDKSYQIYRLDAVPNTEKLPYSLKVLAENLLRNEDGSNITKDHIEAIANWDPKAEPSIEIQYTPARVVMQDFTGVPCIVDLATMREAIADLGGNPEKVNPLAPADLVIDHSVIADLFGTADTFERNVEIEYQRNGERYQFLRWGQGAFSDFKVVPPGTGIVHQVNIEYLARVVMERDGVAYPDTCVGTDSHTTMVNGLGVLGWGVGGIEAEAAMLGQPVSMLIPRVVGFKLTGEIQPGVTATDVVLTVTEMLRKHGVVGKFVEFYGEGVAEVPLANRATLGNMSPEFGSTAAIFPIDEETIDYLKFTGRNAEQVALVETYAKEQGLWHDPAHEPAFSEYLELDLSQVVPSIAGPKRPPGPNCVVAGQVRLPRADPQLRRRRRRAAGLLEAGRGGRRDVPGQRPGGAVQRPRRRPARGAVGRRARQRPPEQPGDGPLRRAGRVRARPRRGGDRRGHVVHQHLQPRGDAGRGAVGAQRR
ncbi:Aconitate hydratase [Mycobacterium avium subsp. paratuberculosis]|nr:Aconitate hydratase [Mycobacterium avium subsp. paratuberculosis]